MKNLQAETTIEHPEGWGAALAAALPLAAYAIFSLLSEPVGRLFAGLRLESMYRYLWLDVLRVAPMPLIFYLLLLGGLLVAWRKAFPRWSYAYLGWLPLFFISGLAIFPGLAAPYLQQRGEVGLRDPYQWRIWGPLLIALLLGLLLDPRLRSLKAGWRLAGQDWTLASFALFGLLEFLLLAGFDEMPGPRAARTAGEWLSVAVLVVGALGYMRARGKARRTVILLSSAVLSTVVSAGIGSYYWHGMQKSYMAAPADGYVLFGQSLMFLAIALAVLLAPWLITRLTAGLRSYLQS